MTQRGILYDTLVNTVRSQIPDRTEFIHAKVTDISTGPERQTVKLSNGEEISARLVVLATGLNIGLRHKLGIDREVISPDHSISIGFDVEPAGRTGVPVLRADLFRRAAGGPDGLHHAVSDRRARCAPTCSPIATCTIPG